MHPQKPPPYPDEGPDGESRPQPAALPDPSLEQAEVAIRQFARDMMLGRELTVERAEALDSRSLFAYRLQFLAHFCVVGIPGLPLWALRESQGSDLDPWDYPPLTVDGETMSWFLATARTRMLLAG